MENRGGDGAQNLGSQHEQFGMPFRGVEGMEAYCGNSPSPSSTCVPGLLRLSQTSQSSTSGVSVPTYSEMHSAHPDPLNICEVHSLQQQHDPDQHGGALRKVSHSAAFSDVRQSDMTTSDEDGSISGKFTVPQPSASPSEGYSGIGLSPQAGKKTKGRVKIKMEYIDNKLRRYTTFSKRKTGIMKKAYELSTLTGTQVMLLVASETGHVYTFATRKLQPMITSEAGKALIQTCLNSPDAAGAGGSAAGGDQRMSATGFEETELCCGAEDEQKEEGDSDCDSSPAGGGRDSALSGSGREAAAPVSVSSAVPSTHAPSDWSAAAQAAHSSSPLLALPDGVVLLNSPTSVIRRVASEHAGEPPSASEPTDLSKSRVTFIEGPGSGPPGRS